MNKTAIKNFAIWARNKLIADITYRAGLLGITEKESKHALPQSTAEVQFFDIGTKEPYAVQGAEISQRAKLAELIRQKAEAADYQTAFKEIVEEAAYTWFNRLIAVRFMEINDYLPGHVRVLSSASPNKAEPDLVTNPFDGDLEYTPYEKDRIVQMKNDNCLDELFRLIFIKQCNALNEILPELFEKTSDYTELLLNISFTDQDGVVAHLVNDIEEKDFDVSNEGQVEIIGWLYQYYNTVPKEETFALLKKNVKITKERIPAATQLFTPDWIVRYMVENSLGRLWLEGHPNDNLKAGWKYYLDEAEQEEAVQKQLAEIREEYKTIKPEDIKIIDPCMGSGHILVYAFELLLQIYESYGYSQRDAAKSIIENNLYGLDIDKRAYQLAYFAVMMKARQYNRRILSGETKPHIYAIQESNDINRDQLQYFGAGMDEMQRNIAVMQMQELLDTFIDAKEYGSILNVASYDWELLHQFVAKLGMSGQLSFDTVGIEETQDRLRVLVEIGTVMARKYDVVVTNPPYMGSKGMGAKLSEYVQKNFPDSKSDLFAVFIERCGQMIMQRGYQAMITQHAWMFLSSYEKLRSKLLQHDIVNMAHLGARAFEEIGGEVVQTTAFVMRKTNIPGYKGVYVRLVNAITQKSKEEMFLRGENRYIALQDKFSKITGMPINYWISNATIKSFSTMNSLSHYAEARSGLQTNDNNRFLRFWFEVESCKIGFNCSYTEVQEGTNFKWAPHLKGGPYRRWYGNQEYVVNWYNNGFEIKEMASKLYGSYTRTVKSQNLYFHAGLTWSDVSTGLFSLRKTEIGCIFDTTAPTILMSGDMEDIIFGVLNSKVGQLYAELLAPTLHYNCGSISQIPICEKCPITVSQLIANNVELAKNDWNSFETAWDFIRNPLVGSYFAIAEAFDKWEFDCVTRFNQMKVNEEKLNRIFIDIYGLQDELIPDVEDKDVTIRKADLRRDIRSFISYAVGCMFGRYSLDVEGLVCAGGQWDASKYSTFILDQDNIIPITDEEYFADDIVGLFAAFVKKVYGEETLEENLDFIAKALGNKGNTSREIIRSYFLKDFFKDHCRIYQKRPIYWLFDSGKVDGFKALIYMHRYDQDTIGKLRVDYLHRLQRIYESETIRMQDAIDNSTAAREVAAAVKRKEKLTKQLKECKEYDEKIAHLALARIAIDLDDGVKVNYEKIQTGADGEKLDVLAKI